MAFEKLKHMMASAPVLAVPDFSRPFLVETDASGNGIGAVLSQGRQPIAFFSKALVGRALNRATYEKELMAVVLAVRRWRPYLLGRRFTIKTDHQSLKHLLEQRVMTPTQQKWLIKLLGYDFSIDYRAGSDNVVADAFSRQFSGSGQPAPTQIREVGDFSAAGQHQGDNCTGSLSTMTLSSSSCSLLDDLQVAASKDLHFQQLHQSALCSHDGPYSIQHGLLLHRGRIVVPIDDELRRRLLFECHNTPVGGHAGQFRTYKRLTNMFFWQGVRKDVQRYVAACDVCARAKSDSLRPAGLLQPLPIPSAIWTDIAMDFVKGLPTSEGKNTILVVVDRLSKYGHFIPLHHPYTAPMVADIFAREIVRLHGIPATIVSDRDKIFISNFWRELHRLQGTALHHSTSYHPQFDGQSEVLIVAWRTTFVVFVTKTPGHGVNSYIGQNSLTIPVSILQHRSLRSKLFMVALHLLLLVSPQVRFV
jgi:hypothetical protein